MINKARVQHKPSWNNTGQATLEFTLIFVIMVFLLMGLLGLWKWSSDNIIKRQVAYNGSRVGAGSTNRGGPLKWSAGAAAITDNESMGGAGSQKRVNYLVR